MRLKERKSDQFISAMLPLFAILFVPLVKLHKCILGGKRPRRILLVLRNQVSADYMVDIANLIKESDVPTKCVITTDTYPSSSAFRDIGRFFDNAPKHILTCIPLHWDLVIFTNHTFGLGLCFPAAIKKLYINHGLHVGKINNASGEDGVYGRGKVCRPFSRPYFDVMAASSLEEKVFAESVTPELRGRVKVTGNLRADKFLAATGIARRKARKKLNIGETERVTHIISTWGDASLAATVGDKLVKEIAEYGGITRFLVSIHPRYNDLGLKGRKTREELLSEFSAAGAMIDSGSDWETFVYASDMAISDHSSVSLFHVLIGNRVVLTDVPVSDFVTGSNFDMLQQILDKYSDYDSIGHLINSLEDKPAVESHLPHLIDHKQLIRGQARASTLMLIDSLIDE